MDFEIEKKFIVFDFNQIFRKLINDFGKYSYTKKYGFWFCNNYSKNEKILNIQKPKILRPDVEIIKKILEVYIPELESDFDFLRIRIYSDNLKKITFKLKDIINKIEQNIEYEFIIDDKKFRSIVNYLKDKCYIFYYNIKETWNFKKDDVSFQLSKISDLKDSYLEVEAIGKNENELHEKLNRYLKLLEDYKLKEEPRNYVELYFLENSEKLKLKSLNDFSREGFKILEVIIKKSE